MMSYFEKVGERSNNPAKDIGILGAPTMTLDLWLQKRKARIGADHRATRFNSFSRNDQLE